MRKLFASFFLLFLSVICPEPLRASVIEYDYTGVVTSADTSTGIAVGTPFSGYFAYDSAASVPGWGQFSGTKEFYYPFETYGALNNGTGMTLEIGGKSFATSTSNLAIRAYSPSTTSDQNLTPTEFLVQPFYWDGKYPIPHLVFSGPNASVYPTIAIPSSFSLGSFSSATLNLITGNDNYGNEIAGIQGKIETLSVGPIHAPEPSVAILFGMAFLGCVARSKFRRS